MKQYIDALNRIVTATERRMMILEQQPKLADLIDQASIRADQMSDAVRKVERAALRKILTLVTPRKTVWNGPMDASFRGGSRTPAGTIWSRSRRSCGGI